MTRSIIGIILLLIGGLLILFPEVGWFFRHGWRFRNAEPSDLALIMERVGGCILCIFGIAFLFTR